MVPLPQTSIALHRNCDSPAGIPRRPGRNAAGPAPPLGEAPFPLPQLCL